MRAELLALGGMNEMTVKDENGRPASFGELEWRWQGMSKDNLSVP
jgi:hypothetical protein